MIARLEYPEGATPLDLNELNGLRFKHVKTQAQLNELEQANIASGLRWLARTQRKDILTSDFVLALHMKLFGDVWRWAGQLRTTEKNIGVDPTQIAVQLRGLLDDVHYWVQHKTYPAIEIAARLHHRLVFIHLFSNGNGRHARIMADVVLEKIFVVAPIDWTGGADLQHMTERRKAYISALRAADNHDIAPLLVFVGAAIPQDKQ